MWPSGLFTEGLDALCGIEVCGYLAQGDDDEVDQTIKLLWFIVQRSSIFFVPSRLITVWRDSCG